MSSLERLGDQRSVGNKGHKQKIMAFRHTSGQGRLHKGGWCEMHHGENWGECCADNDAFACVYNNLLLHEYITPVHF